MSDKDKADRMPGGRADTAVVPLVVDIVTVLGRAQCVMRDTMIIVLWCLIE